MLEWRGMGLEPLPSLLRDSNHRHDLTVRGYQFLRICEAISLSEFQTAQIHVPATQKSDPARVAGNRASPVVRGTAGGPSRSGRDWPVRISGNRLHESQMGPL